jgi:hypothetical protein
MNRVEKELFECTVRYVEFMGLVARMRKKQREADRAMAESDDYSEIAQYIRKAEEIETEVDNWIEKNL